MRNDYISLAQKVIPNPYILVNVVSLRVKQLRHGSRSLVESLEKLSLEDIALREIAERKISFEIETEDSQYVRTSSQRRSGFHFEPVVK